jgi:Galactose oxidase, central domain
MRTALAVAAVVALVAGGCGAGPTQPPVTSSPGRSSPIASGPAVGSRAPVASWTTIAATAPLELLEIAVAARAGRIWVAGGLRADGSASDEVFVLDPAAGTWTTGPSLPEAVHHSSMVSTPEGLVLVGGDVGNALTTATAAVRVLADGATAWTDGTFLPDARAAGAAAFDGTRIVYAGGVKPGGIANEVFARTGGGAWERIGRLPVAREHLAATTDGAGRTFVLGGRVGGLDRNLAIVDMVEGTMVTTVGELPTKRGGVAAFWWPSVGACLAGGESPDGANPQVECMTADGTLSTLPDLGVARHGIGAAIVDGTAYILLGGRTPGLSTSDLTESLALP